MTIYRCALFLAAFFVAVGSASAQQDLPKAPASIGKPNGVLADSKRKLVAPNGQPVAVTIVPASAPLPVAVTASTSLTATLSVSEPLRVEFAASEPLKVEDGEPTLKRPDVWIALATIALTAFTALLYKSTNALAKSAKEEADANKRIANDALIVSRQAAEASMRVAEASTRSAAAMNEQIAVTKPPALALRLASSSEAAGARIVVTLFIDNTGFAPAVIRGSGFHLEFQGGTHLRVPPGTTPGGESCLLAQTVINPGETHVVTFTSSEKWPASGGGVLRVNGDERFAHFFGRIEFEDPTGRVRKAMTFYRRHSVNAHRFEPLKDSALEYSY